MSSEILRQAGFGVPHGRGRIAVDRAEISLAVDQRVAHVEILRDAHERGINDGFTVRMIIAGSIAADFGALAVAAIGGQAEIVHRHQDAALHGLQAVAHVGQRARDDHAHGVVEVRLAHFGFDIDGKQYRCVFFVRHCSSVLYVFRVRLSVLTRLIPSALLTVPKYKPLRCRKRRPRW